MSEITSLKAKVEELSATLEVVKHQYQEECDQLRSEHHTTVTDLTNKLSAIKLQLDTSSASHSTEIHQKGLELDHTHMSHKQTLDSLQSELATLRHQASTARENMATSSSSLVSSLREEVDEALYNDSKPIWLTLNVSPHRFR